MKISHTDIHDNYIVEETELVEYLTLLRELEIIKYARGFTARKIYRGQVKTQTFSMNPLKYKEVFDNATAVKSAARWITMLDIINHRHFKIIDIGNDENKDFVFLIMPFRREEFDQEIYPNLIKTCVIDELDADCRRVDDDKMKNFIENKIYSHIAKAKIVIAELSTENPNVIYELGMAFALGKEVIITYKDKNESNKKKLSFDYEHYDM